MATLGSNTIVNHTSTCESSKKIGMEPTWGPDIETPDFENTDTSSTSAATSSRPISEPLLAENHGRVVDGKAKLVTFDVRLSNTAAKSDEWFPLFPGTDGIVALAMANVIMQEGLANRKFINTWTNYPADKLEEHLKQFTPEMAERYSGVPAKDIRRIAIEFGSVGSHYLHLQGPCKHLYGSYNERCTMLLRSSRERRRQGGYCLPRGWESPASACTPKGKEPSYLYATHYPSPITR
jgi:anaerobic selenocysteine-containing dehydrogenase